MSGPMFALKSLFAEALDQPIREQNLFKAGYHCVPTTLSGNLTGTRVHMGMKGSKVGY